MGCIFCGSTAHNYRNCHIVYGLQRRKQLNQGFKQEFFGQAPNVFVGRYGYPNVRVGALSTEHYDQNDEPVKWSKEDTPIPTIVEKRTALVNSFFQNNVKSFSDRMMDMTKEVSLAKRPTDVEVHLKKKPKLRITTGKEVLPHGPNVQVKKAEVTENVKVDTRVDKAVDATDLKAAAAITSLRKKGVDPYYLTKAFSVGNFGIPTERRLVPTRWSITAVDDIQGKAMINEIKKFNPSDCVAYFGGHYGNHYLILFFDDVWSYELFEQYWPENGPKTFVAEKDYEPYKGRTSYVNETAGGYYAARIGILNKLKSLRKQAAVLTIRIITEDYHTPLGVWVVREAVKKALQSKPIKFADRNLMLQYTKEFLKRKFSYNTDLVLDRSILKKELQGQQKLHRY